MTNTPSGFRDLLPKEAQQKEDMIQKIISVYRKYGFSPLETPIVEFQSTLVGDVTDFNLFNVNSNRERKKGSAQSMAMRFDLTVPLARVVVQYPELPKPFKRYQLGEVFRGERPQKGRYRQFTQLDADIVGSDSIYADADIILMMYSVMNVLGINNFKIRVNTRKILNALPELVGFSEKILRDVLILLDKRDKVSQEELLNLLLQKGLSEKQAEQLVDFGNLSGSRTEVLQGLQELFSGIESAQEGLSDLETINEVVSATDSEKIIFDMSIIRGLAYYTGAVFETVLDDYPQFGSVYSGGRYDNLIEKLGGPDISAVGASVGVDRLLAVLSEMKSSNEQKRDGYVVLVQDSSVLSYAFSIAEKIRSLNIECDVYTGSKNLGSQFGYAESKGYLNAIILGQNELENKSLIVKDLVTRNQKEIPFVDINNLKI